MSDEADGQNGFSDKRLVRIAQRALERGAGGGIANLSERSDNGDSHIVVLPVLRIFERSNHRRNLVIRF